jgi:hypothetical protein
LGSYAGNGRVKALGVAMMVVYYRVHAGPPLGSKNFKKLREKILAESTEVSKFGTNHTFAAM